MDQDTSIQTVYFLTTCKLGKRIRTSRAYWQKIKFEKHPEPLITLDNAKQTLTYPDQIYQSNHDPDILLYIRKTEAFQLIVVVRHLNGDGFLVTVYQTNKVLTVKKKVWPK